MRSRPGPTQIVRRAVEFSILIGFTVATYAAVVVGLGTVLGTGGEPNVSLAVAATAIVAVALPPVRTRASRLSSRLAYGGNLDPYDALAVAAQQASAMLSTEDGLPRMAEVIARGTGAEAAEVWLRIDDRLRLEAVWPPAAESLGDERPLGRRSADFPAATSAAVVHQGEILGALAVRTKGDTPLGEVEQSLLETVASQAGLALRNVALTAELRRRVELITTRSAELAESRRRIFSAQDEERRRLERTIHDGAQQHLVSLAVKLRLAGWKTGSRPDEAQWLLAGVAGDVDAALSSLRDLARGIYPPVLSDAGIAAAVASHAGRLPIEIGIEDLTDGRRFEASVEAIVYFCVVESLRHAAGPASVTIEVVDDDVVFAVSGIVAAADALQHVADRIVSFDGIFESRGGRAVGRVPLSLPDDVT